MCYNLSKPKSLKMMNINRNFKDTLILRCAILSVYTCVSPVSCRVFHVCILGPYRAPFDYGPGALGAALVALDDLRSSPEFEWFWRAGHSVELVWRDSECDETAALRQVLELWTNTDKDLPVIDAVIGPACERVCQTLGLLASVIDLPMISYGCADSIFSDKAHYSTFARTVPATATSFILQIFKKFNWSIVNIITSEAYQTQAVAIDHAMRTHNLSSAITVFYRHDQREHDLESTLKQLANQFRVFLIVSGATETRMFIELCHKLGMTSGRYAFITTAPTRMAVFRNGSWIFANEPADIKVFEGLLAISLFNDFGRPEDDYFHDKVIAASKLLPFEAELTDESQVSDYAHTVYDALLLYMLALNDTLSNVSSVNFVKTDVMNYIYNRNFEGTQGKMYIDKNGDPQPTFTLRNLQNGTWVHITTYESWTGELHVTDRDVTIIWPGGGTKTIPDRFICDPATENCFPTNSITSYLLPILALVVVITIAALVLIRWRSKKKAAKESQEWRVAFNDIVLDHTSRSRVSMRQASMASLTSLSTMLGADDNFNKGGHLGVAHSGTPPHARFRVATYQGKSVSVKLIQKAHVALTDEVILELNRVGSLTHANVNPFVGACVEPGHILVLSTYCSKGSLHDILARDSIKLDRLFKLSFATDIAQGMQYIHSSPIRFHGRLKSTNVLLDSRWRAKVADMDLWKFREGERQPDISTKAYYKELLWTAPEHLLEDELTRTGSPKGDVYSFAIVLHEIIVRHGVFGKQLLHEEPEDIIGRLTKGEHPSFRPAFQQFDADENMLDLMCLCWEQVSILRPNFTTIRDTLRRMNQGRQMNLVDQMMTMMERYTDDLEDLVVARTRMVHEEKRRAEELLYRMLPRAVAEKLKKGETVRPESFENVTVFFSDIVGFTSLAAISSPMQVVDFLNDLYTCFDRIIDDHDVYKVETIGDAYMVVSGLPVRKLQYEHAGEICTMSLNLLSAVRDFRVRHLPEKKIQLRTGIHSGPVVAGVVGLKMPRYCLFGDTVNFASRMESSGLALRIHISPACKALLDSIGGYHLEYRGKVCMKGKGSVDTYFLIGKDGFTKPLPDLADAAPLEEHEFK